MGSIRIKDIAKKAGVSTGTVDRVLHGRGRVSETVKDRVLKIAKELNYKPNYLAQALVSKRHFQIAAIIPDHTKDEYWTAPKRGIEKAEKNLQNFGVNVTQYIFDPFDVESFKNEIKKVSDANIDGVLLAPIFANESLSLMKQWNTDAIPFNLFNTNIPDYSPLSYIGQDSYKSGLIAAYLLQYGHPEPTTFIVVHIDEDLQNSSHLLKKEQGFVDYFSQKERMDFTIIKADLQGYMNKQEFHLTLDRLLENNPGTSGFFVTNSRAFTIAEYLVKRNLKHIRLVGYDLLEKNIHFLNQGIINFLINQNPYKQGYYGIELLIDHLVFKKKIEPIKYLPLDIVTTENLLYYTYD